MSIYESLNPVQQEAVYHTQGPVLILAGAGSGKTRVLTHRIAYLIDTQDVNPWNILAITFTNKAAGEMRERVDQIVGYGSENVWVSTFHSTCVRILRRYIDKLGYDRNFTIYDTDDQKTVIKEVCKKLNIDTKIFKERSMLAAISSAKDELLTAEEFRLRAGGDYARQRIAAVYQAYQSTLRSNNALDFDDLIMKTVELFSTQPDVLAYYQERFKYIMVDEYQDTNTAQFKFVSILASKYKNLCVVGDDDQSIYKFRGANIYNILNFEKEYPEAKVIKLEQNYRSTKNILGAANAVIKNNSGRKDKSLWTSNEAGEPVVLEQYNTEYEEAAGVVDDIDMLTKNHAVKYSDCAVLYRTNAQSRVLEEKFVMRGIPYRMIGGQNFYARKEIKDLLCYLKTIDNGRDDLSVRRIINVPKRGIGAVSLNKVDDYAVRYGLSFFEALERAKEIPAMGKAADKITGFVNMIQVLRAKLEYISISKLLEEILEETGYVKELQAEGTEEALARIENIDELMNKIVTYEEEHEAPTLSEFLEEVSLVADIDSLDESNERVVLMTLHSAKGLEFPYVFMTGLEDGLFPSYMSIVSDDSLAVEEERRLCYVGITRAMKHLTLTYAKSRMVHGSTQYNKVSRFVREIPGRYLKMQGVLEKEKPAEKFVNFVSSARPYEAVSGAMQSTYGHTGITGGGRTEYRMGTGGSSQPVYRKEAIGGGQPAYHKGAIGGGQPAYHMEDNGGQSAYHTKDNGGSCPAYRNDGNAGYRGPGAFGENQRTSGRPENRKTTDDFGGRRSAGRSKLDELLKSQKIFKGSDLFEKPAAQPSQKETAISEENRYYTIGDRVRHMKFGEGTVVQMACENGNDTVTVQFDKAGVKKMRTNFAKLVRI